MATLFDSASLVMLPSGYKDQKLYSIKPTNGDGDFTFSRDGSGASPATRVNSAGNIEKGRTNLLLHSNDFSLTWYSSGVTGTSGFSGYDGLTDAWEATRGGAYNYLAQDITTSGVQTFSTYAKASTFDYLLIRFQRTSSSYAGVYFDLASGVVGSTDGTGIIDSEITSVGNDWYRISITFNESLLRVLYYPVPSDGGVGVGGSGSVFIQDAQLEQGLISTSYIETTTTAVSAGLLGDMPRLDYSGGATCPSLLLEPSRVNIVDHSEYIDGLSKTGVTITANETTSPEGVVNASKVAYASGAAYLVGGSSLTTGTDYTFSGFFKADESNYVIVNQAGAGAKNAFYNLADGTHSGASGITTDMIDYGNGWYRIIYTDNLLYNSIRIYMSGNGSYGNYPSVGEGFFAWGFQTEQASYPTSYIPTYGSASTRGKDASSVTGVSSLIGSTEGTIYLEVSALANDLSERRFALSNGTTGNVARVGFTNVDNRILAVLYNGANQCVLTYQGADITQTNKIAFTYAANDFALYVNGQSRSTDTSGTTFSANTLTEVHFNEGDGNGNESYGRFDQVVVFPTRLTNTELAALTTL